MHQEYPRFAAEIPFPSYTHVPGITAHPISAPEGHSYETESKPVSLPLTDWRQSVEYRYGVDLFNHGYYWEAHEAWEELWNACGRTGPVADALKGLIKLAAAGVKTLNDSPRGRQRHARRAAELFDQAAKSPSLGHSSMAMAIGIPLHWLAARARQAAADEGRLGRPDPLSLPRTVFSFRLLPEAPPAPASGGRPGNLL